MEDFFAYAERIISRSRRLRDSQSRDFDGIDGVLTHIQCIIGYAENALNISENQDPGPFDVLNILQAESDALQEFFVNSETANSGNHGPAVSNLIHLLNSEDLAQLRFEGFTIPAIASLYGCSQSTISRRLDEWGLTHKFTDISDEELDLHSRQILAEFPWAGYRFLCGRLKSLGMLIPRSRTLDAIKRIDPYGIANRFFRFVPRRKYSNPGPNAIWHIDGNHKLVRWGIVIHGIIDGFSRLVISLFCATNNRSSTVLGAFLDAAHEVGVPSRVRSDRGGENIRIKDFMELFCGFDRGSMIQGPSVHNQRIERLWRDLKVQVLNMFRAIFIHMENAGILDIADERHLLLLHFIYLPRIQQRVNEFRETYNNHRLSTESGRTPRQLFVKGILESRLKGCKMAQIIEDFGEDAVHSLYQAAGGEFDDQVHLEDLSTRYPEAVQLLQANIDPLSEDDFYGINLFEQAKLLCGLAFDLGGPRREFYGELWHLFFNYKVPEFGDLTAWETNGGITMPRNRNIEQEQTQRMYEAFGGALWNGIFHQNGFPAWIWNGCLRWMINVPYARGDIYKWSPVIGKMVDKILAGHGTLDRETLEEVEEWIDGADGFPRFLLTAPRPMLAEQIVDFEMITKRLTIFQLIKKGFMKGSTEAVLSCYRADWVMLEAEIYRRVETAAELLEQFMPRPPGNPQRQEIFEWLEDSIVSVWSPDDRRKFLRFVTGADFIPVINRIHVEFIDSSGRNYVPAANTCFSLLKLGSGYENKAGFTGALEYALANFENPDNPDPLRRFQDY